MKKLVSLILALSLGILSLSAQDARQRTVETIVSDVLAQMPAPSADILAGDMEDLAASAPKSVEILAGMLQPAAAGTTNNLVEYALSGLVKYVTDPAHPGSKAKVLEGLAKAAGACTDETNKQFLNSLCRMLGPVPEIVPDVLPTVKEAKELLKSGVTNQMCKGAFALMSAQPKKIGKTLLSALKSGNREYANAVLGYADELAGPAAIVPVIAKNFKKLGNARTDVLNWIGRNKLSSLQDLVDGCLGEAGELGEAAVAAAGKIGGDHNLGNLLSLIETKSPLAEKACQALAAYNGDIRGKLGEALARTADPKLVALAGARRLTGSSGRIFDLVSNPATHDAAVAALSGVTVPDDAAKIVGLLDKASEKDIAPLQKALSGALHTLSAADAFDKINDFLHDVRNPSRLFPSLAGTGMDDAVKILTEAYANGDKKDALTGLLNIDNAKVIPELLKIANGDKSLADGILPRYTSLVAKYEENLDKKRADYASALSLTENPKIKKGILKAVGDVPTMKAFRLAAKYLGEPAVAYEAANSVKKIAAKTEEELDYATLKSTLEKAAAVYAGTGDPDDGYAIDEIKEILSKAEPSPISKGTPEEEKQGFEMLLDGTDLSKWQGDLEGYIPLNGTIYVSANYGSTGNLYTKKEYRNFVYRFEFCFLRPGVNNGVGIRTPMGVDAAYDAMCEVQILDHDAPIYKNLREYQVHGSVYGVVPAKRIVHKPLGEWSTEEIRVEGDHIKVTVNGEVIVDANIRKACKGHNVAPDGSKTNPYTVDKRNHPGMFNKSGYISFCGHGEGLKIRNVRVLDLDKK